MILGEIYIEKYYYDGKKLWYKYKTFQYQSEQERMLVIFEAIQSIRRLFRFDRPNYRISEKSFEKTKKGGAYVIWGPIYFRHLYYMKKLNRPYIMVFPYGK